MAGELRCCAGALPLIPPAEKAVNGLVTGMCIKDFQMSVVDGKPRKEVMLKPGTGRVDFPKIAAALKQGGFTGGPLLIECLGRGPLPSLLQEAKETKAFVEEVFA